jgi:hypothetical protein
VADSDAPTDDQQDDDDTAQAKLAFLAGLGFRPPGDDSSSDDASAGSPAPSSDLAAPSPADPAGGSASAQTGGGGDVQENGAPIDISPVNPQVGDLPAGCQNALSNIHCFIDDATGIGGPDCFYLQPGASLELINRGSQPRVVEFTSGIAADASLSVAAPGKASTTIAARGAGSMRCAGVNGGDLSVIDIVICAS